MPTNNPTVSTADYESAHCKKPRGTGTWAFFFDGRDHDVADAFWANGSYTEAKAAAVAEAKRRGVSRVTVGS